MPIKLTKQTVLCSPCYQTHPEIFYKGRSTYFTYVKFLLNTFLNSEVWHIPNLKPELKQTILSSPANALKLTQKNPNFYESYINVHKSCNRGHPNQMIVYKHVILLHKIYNSYCPQMDWVKLNFNQTLTTRQTNFNTIKSNNF